MTRYIFLSPHLDDIVLSCGAMVDHLNSTGHQSEIWTFFAGDPPKGRFSPFAESLHKRWALPENPVATRRLEDIAACKVLNAAPRHFEIPDCIYRTNGDSTPLITKEDDLYQTIPSQQVYLVDFIVQLLNTLPKDVVLVSPISIGNHVDHRIVRAAVDLLSNKQIFFYKDYPYHVKTIDFSDFGFLANLRPINFDITQTNINHWIKAIKCHKSQISTFWKNEEELTTEILKYAESGGGKSLFFVDKTVSTS